MARGITQTDVDQVADALLLGGERPTVDRIRRHLGTGSPNTVTRMLDVWWKALGSRLSASAAKVALPEAPEAVSALASQFWEQALASARALAEAGLADERSALSAHRLEADARVAAAQQGCEDARSAQTQAASALATALERLKDRQGLITQQASQIADLIGQRDEGALRAAGLETELAALRTQLLEIQADAEARREAQAAHLKAVEDRAHAEVDRARQDAREARTHLQAAERAQTARIRHLEADLGQARSAHAGVVRELAAEQARRETLEQQSSELRRSLEAALKPTVRVRSPQARTKAKPETSVEPARARRKTSK